MADFSSAIWNKPTAAAAAAEDVVTKSLRFNRGDSPKLTRTFGTATSQKKVTISFWIKLAEQGDGSTGYGGVISTGSVYTDYTAVKLDGGTTNAITFEEVAGGAYKSNRVTSRAFRDMGAWMHCVHVIDTTDSTAADRSKLYINGVREETFTTSHATYTLNHDTIWSASGGEIGIGLDTSTDGPYFGGYLADIHYIDGQALDHTSFAEEDGTTGQWKPKEYSGTYGNNGFHLDFADSADIGNDVSGEGNDFTATNLAASDVVEDTPTDNYCVLNPLAQSTYTLSEGNLECIRITSTAQSYTTGTIGVASGKFYWEVYSKTLSSDYPRVGISSYYSRGGDEPTTNYLCGDTDGTGRAWASKEGGGNLNGESYPSMKFNGSNTGSAFVDYDEGDVLQFALDMDNNKLWCGVNGTWYTDDASTTTTAGAISGNTATPAFSDLSGHTWGPAIFCNAATDVFVLNAGQDPTFANNNPVGSPATSELAYTPPENFVALSTGNLPTPAIAKPADYYSALKYTGNGVDGREITVATQPDLLFVNSMDGSGGNTLVNSVEGPNQNVGSYTADIAYTAGGSLNGGVSALATTGPDYSFTATVGSSTINRVNGNTKLYTAWAWKRSATSAFDVITWDGNDSSGMDSAQSVNHALAVTPELIIAKNLTDDAESGTNGNWIVYHKNATSGDFLKLNTNAASFTPTTALIESIGTSSVSFASDSMDSGEFLNAADTMGGADTYMAYLFASVAGYSKVGSFTGSASAFVYTGFRPSLILAKRSDSTGDWLLFDDKRDGYNEENEAFLANSNPLSLTDDHLDILSNGFRIRTTDADLNTGTVLYLAIGQSLKYASAR